MRSVLPETLEAALLAIERGRFSLSWRKVQAGGNLSCCALVRIACVRSVLPLLDGHEP